VLAFSLATLACQVQQNALAATFTPEQAAQLNKLLDDGRALLKNSDVPGALEKFKAAKVLAPDSAVVLVNYGFALGRLGQYDEAIESLKTAVKLQPTLALAWLDLASLYQSSGQIPQAIAAFNDYLKRFPDDPAAHDARSILAILKNNQKSYDSLDGADYYQSQLKAGIQKWDLTRLPLKVFIEEGNPAEGFKPSFKEQVLSAFRSWQEKSDQLITFTFIDSPGDADIVVHWSIDLKALVAAGEAGDCRLTLGTSGIKHAKITILTCPMPNSGLPFNDAYVHWVAAHELGHALGLHAHSPSSKDIMFSTVTFDIDRKDISPKDVATLKRIYESNVQSTGSPVDLYNEAVNEIGRQNQLPPDKQNFLIAIDKLERVRALFPNFDNALGPLGYSYALQANNLLKSSQLQDAEGYYKKALSTIPKGKNVDIENMDRQNYTILLRMQHRDAEATAILH
jgi:tetratricopeptide (TPR) repeat protein